ncbi:MAG: hypothetical protein WCK98_04235 [bacterium]
MPTIVTKTPKKQRFLRLTIDDKLEALLVRYELEYPLLSRVDIVRMLISRSITQSSQSNTKASRLANWLDSNVAQNPLIQNKTEQEQYEILEENDLM